MPPKFKVLATGEVGIRIIVYPDGLVQLKFDCGTKKFYQSDEIIETYQPTTEAFNQYATRGRWKRGTLADATINKMLVVYDFIAAQDKPVTRMEIQNAVGFNCVRHLMEDASNPDQICLETMGLVYRITEHARKVFWELMNKESPEEIAEGREIIENLRGQ